jgi:predicted nucleic acid-binding protein
LQRVFVDTPHYIAVLVPGDDLHAKAMETVRRQEDAEFVTTDAVFGELLAYVAKRGARARGEAVGLIDDLMVDRSTVVVRQTPDLFDRAFALYRRRLDKGYSLTDRMSMVVCGDLGITEVLSHDHHFEQEGFAILL